MFSPTDVFHCTVLSSVCLFELLVKFIAQYLFNFNVAVLVVDPCYYTSPTLLDNIHLYAYNNYVYFISL